MTDPSQPPAAAIVNPFAGGGALGVIMAAHDWSTSPLGAPDRWPAALSHTVQLILSAQAQIVLFWGPDHAALYNDAYALTIGDKHPRVLGRPAREGWAELWDDLRPLLDRVRNDGEPVSASDRPFRIDRHGYVEEVFFDISYSPVRGAAGTVDGVLCIVSETTDRVRAARAAAAERSRLSTMFEQSPSFMCLLRQPGHVFELANASYLKLIGPHEVIGRTVDEVLPELVDQGYLALLDEVAVSGRPFRGDALSILLPRTPGAPPEERWVDFVYQPLTDADGLVSAIFVEGFDVTERHAAEHQLELSRETLQLSTEAGEIGIWDLDVPADALSWSARTKAMFGIAPDAPVSMADFHAGLHPDDRAATLAALAAALDPAQRASYDVEYRTLGAEDGIERWVAARGRALFDEGGRCVRALGTTLDITRRKAFDADLREREERFRTLADSAPALIWVTDERRQIVFANRWFQTMFALDADTLRLGGWRRIIHADDAARFGAAYEASIAAQAAWSLDVRVVEAGGRVRWLHVEGQPRLVGARYVGHVGCAVDVTEAHLAAETLERRVVERTAELTRQIEERERVEATLHQLQRLEAVGQLTSGVAHDFNNLLTVVLGNVGLVERAARGAGLDARTLQRLDHIRTAAERGAALTRQLLAFSRRQRLEARTIDLNDTVRGMQALLASSLGGAVAIRTRLAAELWPALADPTQTELIILNLAINARDAMEVGGTLTIETADVSLGEPTRAEEPPPGDYVMVAVHDTGTGMPPEILAKAFEPFFTTKPVGKGSGLGLPQVFGFAKQSGGGVRIDTVPGRGTSVRVFLPRAIAPATQADEPTASVVPDHSPCGRVLLLDDDDAVRAVTATALVDGGCDVVEAASGEAALAQLVADPAIAAVVADFAMPGMNGAEFARRAHLFRPDLPVLFVTGFVELDALADVDRDLIIQKPFHPEELQTKVRRCLAC